MRYTIVKIMACLTVKEKKKLRQLVSYSGKREELALFKFINNYLKSDSVNKLSKEEVYGIIFPGENYNDLRLRKLMTSLKKQIEDYIVWMTLKTEKATREYFLLNFYENRGATDLFRKYEKSTERELAAKDVDSLPFLPTWIKHYQYYHVHTAKLQPSSELLEDLVEDLEKRFLLRRFFYQVEFVIFNQAIELKNSSSNILWQNVFKELMEAKRLDWPLLNWLWKVFHLFLKKEHQPTTFLSLYEEYKQYQSELGEYERKMMAKLFLNLAKKQLSVNQKMYANLMLEVYKGAIDEGIFLHNTTIDEGQFLNLAITAAMASAFDWLAAFIERYAPFLPEAKQEDCRHLAVAYLKYHAAFEALENKNSLLTEAAKNIALVHDRDPRLSIRIRSLSIRIHFELISKDDQVFFENQLLIFRRYLSAKRRLFTPQLRQQYYSFLGFTQKLMQLKFKKNINSQELEDMIQRIHQEHDLALRVWILEKAEELLASAQS